MIKKLRENYLEIALCLLLIAIVFVTFLQVVFRYAIHFSLAWAEELARFLLLWLGSLASAYAFKTRSHFVLRFFVNVFGWKAQKLIKTVVVFIMSVFMLAFIWKALEYTLRVANQTAPSTRLSMAFPYSSAVVGGVLMLYYILKNWWQDWHQPVEINDGENKEKTGVKG